MKRTERLETIVSADESATEQQGKQEQVDKWDQLIGWSVWSGIEISLIVQIQSKKRKHIRQQYLLGEEEEPPWEKEGKLKEKSMGSSAESPAESVGDERPMTPQKTVSNFVENVTSMDRKIGKKIESCKDWLAVDIRSF